RESRDRDLGNLFELICIVIYLSYIYDMKELKGYIHLYIGCNVFDENNDIWVLAGFTESEVEPGKYIAICKLKPPYHKQVFGELYTDQVKLILRPLESITKEEIREVIQYDKLKDEYKTIEYSFDGILKTIFVDYSVESE